MWVRASELRMLDVVNINDGRRLGHVFDLDLDVRTGQIKALILPGGRGFFSFGRHGDDIVVPWVRIVKIGIDVILVDMASSPQLPSRETPVPEMPDRR